MTLPSPCFGIGSNMKKNIPECQQEISESTCRAPCCKPLDLCCQINTAEFWVNSPATCWSVTVCWIQWSLKPIWTSSYLLKSKLHNPWTREKKPLPLLWVRIPDSVTATGSDVSSSTFVTLCSVSSGSPSEERSACCDGGGRLASALVRRLHRGDGQARLMTSSASHVQGTNPKTLSLT